jgi:hypothetical protein
MKNPFNMLKSCYSGQNFNEKVCDEKLKKDETLGG